MRPFVFCLALVALAACGDGYLGRKIDYTPPPPQDLSALPTDSEGRPILLEFQGSTLAVDDSLDDAVSRSAACLGWVVGCVSPGERELDDCTRAAPRCDDEPGGTCCPESCLRDYNDRRKEDGLEPLAAFEASYLATPSCFPGVDAQIGGAR